MIDGLDAVWLDAGGVLVLPDPTVLGPLLAYYGAEPSVDAHRRAHYRAMAAKSTAGSGEHDWAAYDRAYVAALGVPATDIDTATISLNHSRHPWVWRWPIPESVTALRALGEEGVPLAVVSNASGQIEETLQRSHVCQVGEGPSTTVRAIIDSAVVGVAKPDPAIFDHAALHFPGVDRRRIAYIGDSVTMDVASARSAGLWPMLLDPFDDHPDADCDRIRALGELMVGGGRLLVEDRL